MTIAIAVLALLVQLRLVRVQAPVLRRARSRCNSR